MYHLVVCFSLAISFFSDREGRYVPSPTILAVSRLDPICDQEKKTLQPFVFVFVFVLSKLKPLDGSDRHLLVSTYCM